MLVNGMGVTRFDFCFFQFREDLPIFDGLDYICSGSNESLHQSAIIHEQPSAEKSNR